MDNKFAQTKEFEEKVIALDRVARVVKGGRRFRFRATVVIGDGAGRVGVGVGKGPDVTTSIAKAVSVAKQQMIKVNLSGTSIPHRVELKFSGAHVLLRPAGPGTGVIAGGAIRSVVEAVGIHDLLTKSLGSANKVNTAYATVMALSQLRPAFNQKKPASKDSSPDSVSAVADEAVTKPKPPVKPKAKSPAKATSKKKSPLGEKA